MVTTYKASESEMNKRHEREREDRITVSLSRFNYKRLASLGRAGESLNDCMTRVLNNAKLDQLALDLVRGNEKR